MNMSFSKTPYRLSLFGGGTDYPAWFENNPCKIISAAMANYSYVHVKSLPPFFDHKISVTYSKIEKVNSVDEIEHPSVRACLKYMDIKDNIVVSYDGDLPARSGIGSSSSFTVGLLNALYNFKGKYISLEELSRQAIHIEQEIIGENVGIQDQIMAAHGGIRLIEMGPGRNWNSYPLFLSPAYMKDLESHIMLGFSGLSRHAEVQSKKQVENIKQKNTDFYLKSMSELTEHALEALMANKSISKIGNLMDAGWRLKRNLSDSVTDSWIDRIYEKAISLGAYGGKLMGAGGGGFFLFLVEPKMQEEFKKQLDEIKVWVPFKFDKDGSHIIHFSD